MKKLVKRIGVFVLNALIPKHKNRIYVRCLGNCAIDKYDLLNKNSSNLLIFLDKFLHTKHKKKIVIYLEYADSDRYNNYLEIVKEVKQNNIKLCLIKSVEVQTNKWKAPFEKMGNLIKRFSSTVWLCETADAYYSKKFRCQKVICFNYFISCKNDLEPLSQQGHWHYLDCISTTSLLSTQILAATLGAKLQRCKIIGFARNDSLFTVRNQEKIYRWLNEKIGYKPEHIILYVPTFRDYESQGAVASRELLGYQAEGLKEFLRKTKSVFIYKLHPLQRVEIIEGSDCMIAYEKSYEFSLYDLMAITDCLITDYSSVGYDFLLRNKPIIYNVYDIEKYILMRGVSYEPYEAFCPGPMVRNWEEMKVALTNTMEGKDEYEQKRNILRKIFHKYEDGNSTQRTVNMFHEYTNHFFE